MKIGKHILALFLIVLMLIPGTGTSAFALSEVPAGSGAEAVQAETSDDTGAGDVGDAAAGDAHGTAADDSGDAPASGKSGSEGGKDTGHASGADNKDTENADGAGSKKEHADSTGSKTEGSGSDPGSKTEDPAADDADADTDKEEAADKAGTLEYKTDEYTVTLEYSDKAGIPEGTRLDVREILADSKDKKERKEYNEYFDKSLEQLQSEKGGDSIATLGFARFYDITLIADGREIEPKGDVKVTITYKKDARESVDSEANKASGRKTEDAVKVVHLTESDKTGELEAAAVDKKDTDLTVEKKELAETAFTTDSFSVYGIVYTVDFEYEGHEFSIAGESEILLSEVFARLHIEEDIKDVQEVTFTDPELIKVEALDADGEVFGADGKTAEADRAAGSDADSGDAPDATDRTESGVRAADWKLTSLKPFDTTETLTVKLPEKIIEITVTDDQIPAGMENAVARVSADNGATWSYHTTMSSAANAGNAPAAGTLTDRGALTYARTLTDNVIVETLKENCTLGSATTFDKNANITLRTMSGLGFTSTIHRGWNGGGDGNKALIYLNGANTKFTTEIITFDGTDGTNQLTGRAIHVASGGLTVKDGSTFRNFSTPNVGGAIYSAQVKNTKIQGSEKGKILFENCRATGSGSDYDGGGAIAFIQGARDAGRVEGAKFIDCYTDAAGGAIYVRTTSGAKAFTVTNCVFDGHDNLDRIAANRVNAKWGGAIYIWDGWFALTNCDFTDCTASVEGGAVCDQAGGGDKVELIANCTFDGHVTLPAGTVNAPIGGAVSLSNVSNGTDCIRDITVTDCLTSGNGGGFYVANPVRKLDGKIDFSNCSTQNGHGGGIYFASSVTVDDTARLTFDNCHAGGSGNGGGICFASGFGRNVTIKAAVFKDCSAGGNGGCVWATNSSGAYTTKFDSCKFNGHENIGGNTATATNGGAIYVPDGSLEFEDCSFTNLSATKNGGAICMEGGGGDHLTLTNCTINGHDGILDPDIKNAEKGGGIYSNAAVGTTLNGVTISNCWTSSDGGGIYDSDKFSGTSDTVIFKDCYTTGGKGGGAFFNSTATFGGDVTFEGCHDDSTSTANGGGGAFFNSTVTLNSGTMTFDSCYSASYGGGAYFNAAATLNNQTASFKDCYAEKNGGGAYFGGNVVNTLTGITFTDCKAGWAWDENAQKFVSVAGGNGGGLYKNDGNLTANDITFSGCYASANGGAAYYAPDDTFTLNGASITRCSVEAGGHGSAIFVNSSGKVNFNGGTADVVNGVSITRNTGGGAVEVNNNSAILTFSGNVLVYDNTADGDQKNVVLDRNTNTVIKTSTAGLGNDAHIGVFVTDGEFTRHGEVNDPFGTWQTTDKNLEKFSNDRDDKLFGVSHPGDNLIYWGRIICKIIDANGGEHVFPKLNSAVNHARNNPLDYVDGVCTVQMLVDYVIPKYDVVTLNNSSDNFVFTTAATEDNLPAGEEYFFKPTFTEEEGRLDTDSRETAILQRGWDGAATKEQSLFYVNNGSAKITTTNIIIDGKSPNTSGTLTQRTGRAIYANAGSTVLGEGSTFRNFSTAEAGGAVYAQSISIKGTADSGVIFDNSKTTGSSKSGGAIYANGNVDAEYVTFTTCTATGTGGAIHHNGTGTVNVSHATFGALKEESASIPAAELSKDDVNTAKRTTGTNGGAIYSNTTGNFTLTDCTFYGSYASGSGGAVYLNASSANIVETYSGCVFIGCETPASASTGTNYGGAIGANSNGVTVHGKTNLIGCVFNDCKARLGGAVLARGNTVNVEDTAFNRCSASTYSGGAIYSNHTGTKPTVIVKDSSFKDCTAPTGGALANSDNGWASLTVTGSTFDGCKATGTGSYINGGAIADRAANTVTIEIKDSDFTNCTSAKNGGAIWNKSPMSLDNVTINGHTDGGLDASTANAQLGGAIYAENNVTIKNGVISNCSASNVNGGAVYMNATNKTIYFEGTPVVYGNPSTSTATGSQKNVVLQHDSNTVIQTTTNGLSSGAQIGVYVTGSNPTTNTRDQFYKHGRLGAPYGTYGKNGDYTYFINDRLSTDSELVRGSAKKATDATNIMYWAIEHIPAPTDVDNNYLPYIFVLLAGLALAAAAVCAKRRRSAEEEYDG